MSYVIKPTFGVTGKSGAGAQSVNGLHNDNLITISGAPPLTVTNAKAAVPQSIAIYGNTVNGVGVGNMNEFGVYEVPITIRGKNLFDGLFRYGNYNQIINTRLMNKTPLPCRAGETYTLSMNSKFDFALEVFGTYNSSTGFYSDKLQSVGWTVSQYTLSVQKSGYICLTIRTPENDIISEADLEGCNIQLEYGPKPTEYEAYHAPQKFNVYADTPLHGNSISSDVLKIYPFSKRVLKEVYDFTSGTPSVLNISYLQDFSQACKLYSGTTIIDTETIVSPSMIKLSYN